MGEKSTSEDKPNGLAWAAGEAQGLHGVLVDFQRAQFERFMEKVADDWAGWEHVTPDSFLIALRMNVQMIEEAMRPNYEEELRNHILDVANYCALLFYALRFT